MKMANLGVPQVPLKKVLSSGFSYIEGRGVGGARGDGPAQHLGVS